MIIITKDATGNPKMPTFQAKAAVKGGNVDLSTLKIRWKTRVEYFVNTVAAPERSRKGLDLTGSGQGTDGFIIIEEKTGPAYTIPWTTNFGGGTLGGGTLGDVVARVALRILQLFGAARVGQGL